jgi:cytochrome c-type biogenesis protein CcmH
LAQHEYNLGNFKAASQAKSREIELLTGDASPADYTELAEMMIAATGGYVSPEAEGALNQALRRDPNHGPARYYWGLMLAQVDRPDLAFGLWSQTLRNGPEGAPWINAIRQNIEDMAWRAGIQYQLPEPGTTAPGPDADDVAAAQEMTTEERQEMIRGMVDRLSDRLATDGGAPDEWARLIAALGVLGERDRAQAILKEAQQVFAGNDAALAMIVSAGIQAGLIECSMTFSKTSLPPYPPTPRWSVWTWGSAPSGLLCPTGSVLLPRRWKPSVARNSPWMPIGCSKS